MLILPEKWTEKFRGKDAFMELFSLEGKIYRNKEGRKTLKIYIDGKSFFAKFHSGIGWKEIFKNLVQLRKPVLSAQNEWKAIKRLEQLEIHTMTLAAYGKRGWNPAHIQSFVITEELTGTTSLEDLCKTWPENPPSFSFKKALIHEVAKIARTIHQHGINHRDFYICHFLLDASLKQEYKNSCNMKLFLIDLHRVEIHKRLPMSARIKDIGALFFSAMDIGLTKRDFFRFIKGYGNKTLRASLEEDSMFWKRVEKRGLALYRKGNKEAYF